MRKKKQSVKVKLPLLNRNPSKSDVIQILKSFYTLSAMFARAQTWCVKRAVLYDATA